MDNKSEGGKKSMGVLPWVTAKSARRKEREWLTGTATWRCGTFLAGAPQASDMGLIGKGIYCSVSVYRQPGVGNAPMTPKPDDPASLPTSAAVTVARCHRSW